MKIHWLYQTKTIRKLWLVSIFILALTLVGEFVVDLHPHFHIAELFGFHALFGFLSCVAMIIFAKLLGFFIKRREDYYDR